MTTRDKQQTILLAIAVLTKDGTGTTIREIQTEAGISSTSVVTFHLRRLRERGLVTWRERASRTIRLVKRGAA